MFNNEQVSPLMAVEAEPQYLDQQMLKRRALRVGIGTAILFLLGVFFDWTMAYMTPVFALGLLQSPKPIPYPAIIKLVLVSALIMGFCYLLAGFSRNLPVLFILLYILMVFKTFTIALRGGPLIIVAYSLAGLVIPPLIAKVTTAVAWDYCAAFVGELALGALVANILFMFFPELPNEPQAAAKKSLSEEEIPRGAFWLTLMLGSYSILFWCFDWTNLHTPLYIAIFAIQMNFVNNIKNIKGVLSATVVAGFIAIIAYEVFVMVPNFLFISAVSLSGLLFLAKKISSGKANAPFYAIVQNALLIMLGSALVESDTANNLFWYRFGELAVAGIWVIGFMCFVYTFFPGQFVRDDTENLAQPANPT